MPELAGTATLDDVVLSVQVVSISLLVLTAATELDAAGAVEKEP